MRLYNDRHDSVLGCIHSFLSSHMFLGSSITVDLPNSPYTFPQNIVAFDVTLDTFIWNNSVIHMVELTIPFETGIDDAAARKQAMYAELAQQCRKNGYETTLTTVEVCSRGFIHVPSFNQLYKIVDASPRAKSQLEREIIQQTVQGLF